MTASAHGSSAEVNGAIAEKLRLPGTIGAHPHNSTRLNKQQFGVSQPSHASRLLKLLGDPRNRQTSGSCTACRRKHIQLTNRL
jgi:hypothetical protein